MSGIFGVFHLDGQPVQTAVLQEMSAVLAHRGQDNSDIWASGTIGLGNRLLWTTPESLREKMPLSHQSGAFVLTADARIDNRDELIAAFGLRDRPSVEITGSDLILFAYEKWGTECPKYLLGAFAFSIWDEREQQLFCARDHFGIRPFYYYTDARLFTFSSEIKALLRVPQVPHRLNENRIAQQLLATVDDKAITFYENVWRLPPAHTLTISRSHAGLTLAQYWALDPTREVELPSDEAYAEAFLELFTTAVRSRMRTNFPIGVMLSGGLDSSAVACVARRLPEANTLQTFSAIYSQTKSCDESDYIDAVLAQGNMQPHYVDVDQLNPLGQIEQILRHVDEPFTAPTYYIMWAMFRAAHNAGVRVMLDGIDGDTAVYHGDGYLADLAQQGEWGTFVSEAVAIAQHENLPPASYLFHTYGRPHLTSLARRGEWVSFLRQINSLAQHVDTPRRQLLKNYGLKPVLPPNLQQAWRTVKGQPRRRPETPETEPTILRPEFARRIAGHTNGKAPQNGVGTATTGARAEHHALLSSGLLPYGFELAEKVSAAFGIEGRHPFADRRLIEFSLATPPAQKLHQGWIRMILRRALEGILPSEIQWRGGKTINTPAVTNALLKDGARQIEREIIDDPTYLEPYADVSKLRQIYRRYRQKRDSEDEMVVWQAATLSMWLRQF